MVRPNKFERQPGILGSITLVNYQKRPRLVAEIPVFRDDLRYSPAITYVFRFEDGNVLEVPGPGLIIAPTEATKLKPLPVAFAGEGKVMSAFDLCDLFGDHPLCLAFNKCQRFCITAIVQELELKSNTVFVNGMCDLRDDYDPFADAKTYRRLKALREKREP